MGSYIARVADGKAVRWPVHGRMSLLQTMGKALAVHRQAAYSSQGILFVTKTVTDKNCLSIDPVTIKKYLRVGAITFCSSLRIM